MHAGLTVFPWGTMAVGASFLLPSRWSESSIRARVRSANRRHEPRVFEFRADPATGDWKATRTR
jgi:hypothetical protein